MTCPPCIYRFAGVLASSSELHRDPDYRRPPMRVIMQTRQYLCKHCGAERVVRVATRDFGGPVRTSREGYLDIVAIDAQPKENWMKPRGVRRS